MDQSTQHEMVYIAGGPGGDSIAPPIHDYVAHSLGLHWTCEFLRFTEINEVMARFHRSDFAGGIVTMPHKRTIIPLLDSVDEIVKEIGACNFVFRGDEGRLHGSNTDWVGIKNAFEAESGFGPVTIDANDVALVVGAGGASRAAVYALVAGLGCQTIYIVNRDGAEVEALEADIDMYTTTNKPQVVHVTSVGHAAGLQCPRYIVSTVPDHEPTSEAEIRCREVLDHFLDRGRGGEDNFLLDMCYHPPVTRNIKAGMEAAWKVIPGYVVVGYQFERQWELWTGKRIDMRPVLTMCRQAANDMET